MEQLSQSSTKDVFDLFNKIGEHTNCLRLRAEESEKQCLILNELLDGYRRKEDMATVSMQKQQYNCIHCAEMKLSHGGKLSIKGRIGMFKTRINDRMSTKSDGVEIPQR
eukprot:m.120700 g.120700  ORF g.120700 m.120700 type:complete len:109 (-) comp9373_c0_seq19:1585-1911(-)